MRRALAAILIATSFLAVPAARAAQPPAGNFYQLSISASFESPFSDCWAFSSNGRFIVSHSGLGSFPYQLDNLNASPDQFQAVWRGRLSIGFSGTVDGSNISGNGVDSTDRTYHFTGSQVSSCAAAGTRPLAGGFQTR